MEGINAMFEFKERYFTYELWNALRLKSSNQLRMYEILKQYEFVGERVISITELRTLLGIKTEEYKRYNSFRERVIDSCCLKKAPLRRVKQPRPRALLPQA